MKNHFQESFKKAQESETPSLFRFEMAGFPIAFCVCGERLFKTLCRPYQHLKTTRTPELVFHLWDEQKTGVEAPSIDADAVRSWEVFGGLIELYDGGRYLKKTNDAQQTWFDQTRSRIYGSIKSVRDLPRQEKVKPYFPFISLFLQRYGRSVIHAGCVASADRGAVVVGFSGAGKSTTTVTALMQGMTFLCDDMLILEETANSFSGHSTFNTISLSQEHLARLNRLGLRIPERALLHCPPEKSILFAQETEALCSREVTLKSVIVPRVVGKGPTRLRSCTAGQAFKALAPSTMVMMDPQPDESLLPQMKRLVTQLPCFELELGESMETLSELLEGTLQS